MLLNCTRISTVWTGLAKVAVHDSNLFELRWPGNSWLAQVMSRRSLVNEGGVDSPEFEISRGGGYQFGFRKFRLRGQKTNGALRGDST